MSRVLTLVLSGLAFVWTLAVISPVDRPVMLLIGVWAILRAYPTKGRCGPAIDTAWVVLAMFGLGWPLARGEQFVSHGQPDGRRCARRRAGDAGVLGTARRTTGWILPVSALLTSDF